MKKELIKSNRNLRQEPAQPEEGVLNRLRNTITGIEERNLNVSHDLKRNSIEAPYSQYSSVETRSSFTPPFDITTWLHPETLGQQASVYIWLPTNSSEETLAIKVTDEGTSLEVKIQLPPPFLDMEIMHKRWLKSADAQSEKYHPKYMAYKTLVNEWQIEIEEDRTSTAHILLPFPCKSNIEIENLGWSADNTLVVNIDLTRADEDIVERKKMKPFHKD